MRQTRPSMPFNGHASGEDMGKLEQLNRRTLAEQVDRLAENLNTNAGILEALQAEVLAHRDLIDGLQAMDSAQGGEFMLHYRLICELRDVHARDVWGRLRWLLTGR